MELSPISTVWLALSVQASEVTLTRAQFDALQPEPPPRPEPSPGALVVARDVRLDPVGDERVDVHASWQVVVTRPVAVTWALAGPGVTVQRIEIDGRSVSVTPDDAGNTVLSTLLVRSSRITIVGSVEGDPGSGAEIVLLEAGSGTVTLPSSFVSEGAVWLGPGRAIGAPARIRLAPAPARSDQGTLVLGETALGLTVGEAELFVRGRVRWRIARGWLDQVGFTVPGAGPDLEVTGPQIASWNRSGDHVDVVLREPSRSLVAVEVRYSAPVPGGETGTLVIPDLRADGVFRTTSSVQIARDGQVDVIPTLPGWQPTASSALPEWGRSLVEGVPTAAYVGQGGGGTVTLYRFTPADSPATIIDVAGFTLAATAEGRVLMRANYAVRNDRGATLRVTPPPGLVPIGVRVGGEEADIARDGDVWLVPLRKSVETVEGLLSFPVEVNFLGEVGSWSRRERRNVVLPSVDVEVAVSRVTVYLPPGFRSRIRPGYGDAVEAFTEGQGITYGFAVGDVRAAQADALFQQAVDAWMDNSFDETTEILDQLEGMGADNVDIGRLRSNLSVIESTKAPESGAAVALERRVLEQARARSDEDARKQEAEVEKANQAYASGDYKAAEESYRQALDLGEDLAKLQTGEDLSQEEVNVEVRNKLAAVQQVGKQKADNMASQSSVSGKKGGSSSVFDEPAKVVVSDEEERPEPIESPSPIVDTESTTTGQVLTMDFLQRIPSGRTYQTAVETLPGVGSPPEGKEPAADPNFSGYTSNENVYEVDGVAANDRPTTRAFEGVVQNAPGRAGNGSRADRSGGEEPPPPPADRGVKTAKDEGGRGESVDPAVAKPADPMAVTAATLSVVIPTIGEGVHYQRLLLPAGTVWEVPVSAREHRRNR